MARFSIRQLLVAIALIAMVLAAFGSLARSRWQSSEIDILNYSLESTYSEMQVLGNVIIQCETSPKFSHLEMSSFLKSFAGNEFAVDVSTFEFTNPDCESKALVAISAEFPGHEYIAEYGPSKLGETALVVYNLDRHRVVDAIKTTDYSGFSRCSEGLELSIGNSSTQIVATQNGFVTIRHRDITK